MVVSHHGNEEIKWCPACGTEYSGIAELCPGDGTRLTVKDALIGTILAERYKILSPLGSGGMSNVYKAQHQLMGRLVAIKLLHAEFARNKDQVQRFQQEAAAISNLSHPNIITVFDFGISSQHLAYLAMEYLSGPTIEDAIAEKGYLPVKRCIPIFSQTCDALGHAHAKGIIHRDIKPSNIMLIEGADNADCVKVLDFGLAKLLPQSGLEVQNLTLAGEVFGSPPYMSPEQCRSQKLDERSDIYSLGCVLYQALTGHYALIGQNVLDTMQKHTSEMPLPFQDVRPDLYIPPVLEAAVFKAMSIDPAFRQQSMAELKEDLLRVSTPSIKIEVGKQLSLKSKSNANVTASKRTNNLLKIAIVTSIVAVSAIPLWLMANVHKLDSSKATAPEAAKTAGADGNATPANKTPGKASGTATSTSANKVTSQANKNNKAAAKTAVASLPAAVPNKTATKSSVSASQASSQQPKNTISPTNQAKILYETGQAGVTHRHFKKAIKDLSQAISLAPKYAEAYNERGIAYNHMREFRRAIIDFSTAIACDPTYSSAFSNRGTAYLQLNDLQQANQDFTQAIHLAPNNASAYSGLAMLANKLGHYRQAIEFANKAIQFDSHNHRAYLQRGLARASLGQYQPALSDYNQATAVEANNPACYIIRGTFYHEILKQYQNAVNDFSKAINLDPNDYTIYVRRGNNYRELGQYRKAIDDYSRAISIDPTHAPIYQKRALVYEQLGQRELAAQDRKLAQDLRNARDH